MVLRPSPDTSRGFRGDSLEPLADVVGTARTFSSRESMGSSEGRRASSDHFSSFVNKSSVCSRLKHRRILPNSPFGARPNRPRSKGSTAWSNSTVPRRACTHRRDRQPWRHAKRNGTEESVGSCNRCSAPRSIQNVRSTPFTNAWRRTRARARRPHNGACETRPGAR